MLVLKKIFEIKIDSIFLYAIIFLVFAPVVATISSFLGKGYEEAEENNNPLFIGILILLVVFFFFILLKF